MMKRGFTLVEIVLTIALVGTLFALSAVLLDRGVASFASISKRGSNNEDVRFAMERMTREILLITAGPQGTLGNLNPSQISFTDRWGSNADFHWTGSTLYRGSDILLNHVTGLTFTGYRSDNQVTSSNPQVRRIRVQLTTLPEGQTATLTTRTDIFLRSEMYVNFQQ